MAAAWCLHSERRIIKGNSSLENFEDFICGGVLVPFLKETSLARDGWRSLDETVAGRY